MRKTNCRIGFDDRLLLVVMIPLIAFIVPIVFSGVRFYRAPYYEPRIFFTTLLSTALIWFGNRLIMIQARRRYPQFDQTRRRLIIQSLAMLVFTLASNNILGYLLRDYCNVFDASGNIIRTVNDMIINTNNAAIFCVVMIVAIYEGIYFNHQLRQSIEEKAMLKRESLHAEINALKAHVNPHFLFNNLNTLSAIIPEHPQQAIDFVQQLSKVYRHILEVKDEESISVKDELDVLKAYAFLLKTRFGNNIDINFDIPEDKYQHRIVPLSLQLLMENAVKHNIVSMDKPLQIRVYCENGNLVISNNLQVKNQVSESTGFGLENIRNRYKLLGNKDVKVSDDGGSFTVSIPLIPN